MGTSGEHLKNGQGRQRPLVTIGYAKINPMTFSAAVDAISSESALMAGATVVTPNVDHVLRLERDEDFRSCYDHANFVLCDGMPVYWAARIQGTPVPERVTGADLMPALCEAAARRGLSVAFVGGPPGTADAAARNLMERFAGLKVAWTYCPPLGFEKSPVETRRICDELNARSVNLVFLGVGSPKQEKWAEAHRRDLKVGAILSIGAAIEFAAGSLPRAPRWMQTVGLEWVYRTLQDPVRLGKRYAGNSLFLKILARCLLRRYAHRSGKVIPEVIDHSPSDREDS